MLTWQSSFDSSRVWAKATGVLVVARHGPESCPNNGSIPCLLLESIGNQKGPRGGRLLADTTFVQRLNTNGGAAPTTSCSVGQTLAGTLHSRLLLLSQRPINSSLSAANFWVGHAKGHEHLGSTRALIPATLTGMGRKQNGCPGTGAMLSGRSFHVLCRSRKSMPSESIDNCARVHAR